MGYIIPGGGIVNDTEEGFGVIIPGFGIYNEQAEAITGIAITTINYNGLNLMVFSAGRQSQCQAM